MAETWCPDLSADAAQLYVDQAHNTFMQRSTQTYNLAVGNLEALKNIPLNWTPLSVSFNFDGQLTPFRRPTRPDLAAGDLEFRAPDKQIGAAPTYIGQEVSIDPAPELDATAPTLTFMPTPVQPDLAAPAAPAKGRDLVMPDAPTLVLPDVPSLQLLHMPDLPVIELPVFQGTRPVFIAPPVNENWTFQPEAYTQNLVEAITAELKPMIVGSPALPRKLEAYLFERSRSRIELETNRAVDQAFADTANRGFSAPQGVTHGRTAELRQAGLNAIADAQREVDIEQFRQTIELQKFAITQGAALEGTLIQLHVEEQRFLLAAAQYQRDSQIAIFNARVTAFNAEQQAYATDAQVFRDLLQAELTKLETFRAQLEGERLRGEINTQAIALYNAQLDGVTKRADLYRTQVETVKVQADVQMQQIERYRAEVQAYNARWEAYATEWNGWTASAEGQAKRVDVYRSLVDMQAKRVDAWATTGNFKIEQERLRIAQHGTRVDVWRTGLEELRTQLETERSRLTAVGQAWDARARMYTADATVEQAASAATDRSFELGLAKARADADYQLQLNAQNLQQAQSLLQMAIEIARTAAQVGSQLASSTMSAVNYGASISSGRSKSISCSQSFSFAGEIADA